MIFQKTCLNCNKIIIYNNKYNLERSIRDKTFCRSCTCKLRNDIKNPGKKGSNNPQWKGYNEIPYTWFSKYFERAGKRKTRTGTITIQDVYNLWILQNKKCKLSGLDIGFKDCGKTGSTCSIDRIDSKKEYDLNNIQLVHKDINLMKNHFNNDYFINICKLISNNNV